MDYLFPILFVAGVGLLAGVILAIASIVMAVPKDETAEAIQEVLPGANCGACGFSGCSGYAEALAKGEAKPGLCAPGGPDCAAAIAAILGTEAEAMERKAAVVACTGTLEVTSERMIYDGIPSCAAAAMTAGGPGSCRFGCIGLGDCAAACPYGAIKVCNGLASIDTSRCKACGLCVAACPHHLISLHPAKKQAKVLCSNCDKGASTMKACTLGCIGCMKCIKTCEEGAITVENFCAKVNPEKCIGCGKCVDACPRHVIQMLDI